MMRPIVAALMMIGLLGACASPRYVTADVTRFHSLAAPDVLRGKTFAIVAVTPEQGESIAFHQFADSVNARLSSFGMTQYTGGGGPTGADYIVNLHYAVSGPTPDVRTRYYGGSVGFGYGYGWGGWRRPYWGYGFAYGYDPFWDDYPVVDTRQLFVRRAEVDIYNGGSYSTPSKQRVFEGRAISTGTNGEIEPVMPYLIDAIFRDFPGLSGKTQTVRVEVPPEAEHPAPTARAGY